MNEMMESVGEHIRAARRMAVLSGAGISAESGVPTFRGPEGLWKSFRPEELATPEAFARDPKLVWEWYDWRRQRVGACEPNAAHKALARLEERFSSQFVGPHPSSFLSLGPHPQRRWAEGSDFTLVTQNVDGLHRVAGSRNVVEIHGDIWRLRCTGCARTHESRDAPLARIPPQCDCGSLLRPDVVWFGEPLPEHALRRAVEASSRAEVMLVVGTSALVYPAAALPRVAKEAGAMVVEINAEETPLTAIADAAFHGKAALILPEVCRAAGID